MKAPTNLSVRGSEQHKQSSLSDSSTTNEIWQGKRKDKWGKKQPKQNPCQCAGKFSGVSGLGEKSLPRSAWCCWELNLCCRLPSAWVPVPEVWFIPSEQQTTQHPSTGVTSVLEDPATDCRLYLPPLHKHQPRPAQTNQLENGLGEKNLAKH